MLQHTRCVALQAEIWTACDEAQQQIPSLEGWGWTFKGETTVGNDLPKLAVNLPSVAAKVQTAVDRGVHA